MRGLGARPALTGFAGQAQRQVSRVRQVGRTLAGRASVRGAALSAVVVSPTSRSSVRSATTVRGSGSRQRATGMVPQGPGGARVFQGRVSEASQATAVAQVNGVKGARVSRTRCVLVAQVEPSRANGPQGLTWSLEGTQARLGGATRPGLARLGAFEGATLRVIGGLGAGLGGRGRARGRLRCPGPVLKEGIGPRGRAPPTRGPSRPYYDAQERAARLGARGCGAKGGVGLATRR